VSPEKLLYAKTHEWVHIENDAQGHKVATVGISAFAVESLTDLVYMQLPQVGRKLKAGEPFGEIESVKAVSDLYSPVDGEVVAINEGLPAKLELLNGDPFGGGWLVKIKLSSDDDLRGLLDYQAYQKQCAEEQH
jgi:glycine cleavage system H protein